MANTQRTQQPRSNDAKQKPVHEVRLGRIKAAIWANETDNGTRHNVTINSIQPGSFETDRQKAGLARTAAQRGVTMDAALAESKARIPAGRFGDPAEFGALCAFLAGAQAGFITGQNILIDGGAFPGAF